MNKQHLKIAVVAAAVSFASGCATVGGESDFAAREAELNNRAKALDEREAALSVASQQSQSSTTGEGSGGFAVAAGGDLLPPNAAPGECYARVWVDAQYETLEERVMVSEEAKKITVIPAQYETVTETVEVKVASSRLETIPAVYGTETEQVLVRDATRTWRIDTASNSAPASDALLASATAHGINLDAARPGMCFHEHFTPAQYQTVSEQVLLEAETETVQVVPAQYQMVEKQVLVKEASSKLVTYPAEYNFVEEQVIDKPAHTIWKKGTGPIQKIDEATGEIMCLVEVPATYKTIRKRVLSTPARTETIEIPAEYKTVSVREMVAPASESRTPVPAVYGSVEKQVVASEGSFVWHEVSNTEHPAATRTGNQICLTESPAQYKTVTRKVVETPAQTREIAIPAEYQNVQQTKLVAAAREEVEVIPAEYKTVTKRKLLKDGYMAWRSILCETNMTRARISDIQRALNAAGYDVGPADGVIGAQTIEAVNAFQRANDLPVDRYLNIETVKALGVSTN